MMSNVVVGRFILYIAAPQLAWCPGVSGTLYPINIVAPGEEVSLRFCQDYGRLIAVLEEAILSVI